jgi:transposase
MYNQLRKQETEKRAAELTLARYAPREDGHFPLSLSTIRNWARQARREGMTSLYPKSRRPKTIHYQVPEHVVDVIYVLRKLFGWGGHRIAAEIKARGIGSVSGQGVYNIFERLGLPVKIYALKGRSEGIAYTRYEKKRPNEQWHIDLKHLTLTDGTKVYICVIIDDYSRYALAAVAGAHKTTDWVARVAQDTIVRAGRPAQMVSDNGREFVTVWEDVLTTFGHLLLGEQIEHATTAPYYPQGNGKAEAFIRTLNRELLSKQSFETLDELQAVLDRYLTFYNNYRAHSALDWKPPVTRYAGCAMQIEGLAGIPGVEPMAADPRYGPAYADPPVSISPTTAVNSRALALVA